MFFSSSHLGSLINKISLDKNTNLQQKMQKMQILAFKIRTIYAKNEEYNKSIKNKM